MQWQNDYVIKIGMEKVSVKRRRAMTLLAGFAGLAVLSRQGPKLYDRLDSSFQFTELESPQGFRALDKGQVSTVLDPFIGLDTQDPWPTPQITDITNALHPVMSKNEVHIAYFTDTYCPYCRVLGKQLIAATAEQPVTLNWHETPIFGEASIIAAKALIAAGAQGKRVEFYKALTNTPARATVPYLQQMAQRLGLNTDQFSSDMNSDQTLAQLGTSRALANLFGFVGTPATIIGRTVVIGTLSETNLRQLIDLELSEYF